MFAFVQVWVGTLNRVNATSMNITGSEGMTLDIFVENQGHINYGSGLYDPKVGRTSAPYICILFISLFLFFFSINNMLSFLSTSFVFSSFSYFSSSFSFLFYCPSSLSFCFSCPFSLSLFFLFILFLPLLSPSCIFSSSLSCFFPSLLNLFVSLLFLLFL